MFKQAIKNTLLRLQSTKSVFTKIYLNNHWQSNSLSGPGSELSQTKALVEQLPLVFEAFNIQSILDAPCGDFNWMQEVCLDRINYLGADIVTQIIEQNNKKHAKHNIQFLELNIIKDPLPKVDLIFIRDCFVHFSYSDISLTLENIKKSGITFIATTTFSERKLNSDIPTGEWRPLNFNMSPFFFPKPLMLINEQCTENNGQFKDKSIGIWRISDLA